MAAIRSASRLASRAQALRQLPTSTVPSIRAQRSFVIASRTRPSQSLPTIGSFTRHVATKQPRPATDEKSAEEAEQGSEDLGDPNMNGNYPDPSLTSALPIKRQHRDPYADWWDPQERRNYGEPVHEDNDILGIFSPDDYTHFTPAWGLVLWACFIATFSGVCLIVYQVYPDKPAVDRVFPGGLEEELGGPRAPRAKKVDDDDASFVESGSRSTL